MTEQKKSIPKMLLGFFLETFQTIFISLVITGFIYFVIASPHLVEGSSMEVNFYNGELILSEKIINYLGGTQLGDSISYDLRRGSIIIFHFVFYIEYSFNILLNGIYGLCLSG